jgi:multidrug resistance efflux pump
MVLDSLAIRWPGSYSLTLLLLFAVLFCNRVGAQEVATDSKGVAAPELSELESKTISVENALLKPFESTKISSEVEGRIAQLTVREGDWVSKDQLIGNMDDRAVRLQLARSNIATSMAQLKVASPVEIKLAKGKAEVAKNELDRAVVANSRVSDTYPLKEVDRLRLVYDSAILEVDRAVEDKELQKLELKKFENEQAVIEDQLAKHQIKSPVNGMVVSMSKHSGEWVQPGTEILQIVRLDRLKIEGFVKAGQLDKLSSRKASATVQHENKEIRVSGKVFFVFPEINPLTKEMRIQLEVDNPGGQLVPGSPVRAAILPN